MHGMEDKFGEVLVPTEEVIEMRAGQKRKSERTKFFPGYVLVQMVMDETSWHLVRSVPRSWASSAAPRSSCPISDKEADAILNRLQTVGDKAETEDPV